MLILVLLAGIFFKLVLDISAGAVARARQRPGFELRRYWLALGLLVAGVVAYGLLKTAEGQPLSSGLRAYAGTAKVHYSLRDVLRWSVYHAGELALAVGVIPACALFVLLGLFRASWQATAAERAYLAVTLAAVPLILVEVGAYASRYSLRGRGAQHALPRTAVTSPSWCGSRAGCRARRGSSRSAWRSQSGS